MWSTLKSLFAESEPEQKTEERSIPTIESQDHLNSVLEQSHHLPVFLFKHSTRCSISSMALREFRDFAGRIANSGTAKCFILDLVRFRDISNSITERLGVIHQSPQAMLIHQEQPLWHQSHGGISSQALQAALDQCRAQQGDLA